MLTSCCLGFLFFLSSPLSLNATCQVDVLVSMNAWATAVSLAACRVLTDSRRMCECACLALEARRPFGASSCRLTCPIGILFRSIADTVRQRHTGKELSRRHYESRELWHLWYLCCAGIPIDVAIRSLLTRPNGACTVRPLCSIIPRPCRYPHCSIAHSHSTVWRTPHCVVGRTMARPLFLRTVVL